MSDVWTTRPDGSGRRLVLSDPAAVSTAALSPDGRLLALSLRGKAELLDLRTRRLRALPIRTPSYAGFAWSPDGRLLLHQGDHGLHVLRLGDGRDRRSRRSASTARSRSTAAASSSCACT